MKLILGFIGLLCVVNVVIGFQKEGLNLHNKYRKAHNVGALLLDNKLNQQAQECAQRVANLNKGNSMNLVHTDRKLLNKLGQGENLSATSTLGSKASDVQDAIKRWYNEVKFYNFNRPGVSSKGEVRHFTQVVWKDTKKLGLGIAYVGKNAFICARYLPTGNFNEAYKQNVFKG